MHEKPYKLAVLACGRSGTATAAAYFTAAGVHCGHETLAPHHTRDGETNIHVRGVVGWPVVFTYRLDAFEHVWHQVRHPLDVIASTTRYKTWATRGVLNLSPDNKVLRGMQYWLYWNLMCEHMAEYTYRIEDLGKDSTLVAMMAVALGVPIADLAVDPGTRNNKDHAAVTWADCEATDAELTEAIRKQAGGYGYNV
jgi:hypothetical protein